MIGFSSFLKKPEDDNIANQSLAMQQALQDYAAKMQVAAPPSDTMPQIEMQGMGGGDGGMEEMLGFMF